MGYNLSWTRIVSIVLICLVSSYHWTLAEILPLDIFSLGPKRSFHFQKTSNRLQWKNTYEFIKWNTCLKDNIWNLNSLRGTDFIIRQIWVCILALPVSCVWIWARPYFFGALNFLISKLRLTIALNSQSNCKIKSICYAKWLNSVPSQYEGFYIYIISIQI